MLFHDSPFFHFVLFLLVCGLSFALAAAYLRVAKSLGVWASTSQRSAHQIRTPTGGGLVIAALFLTGVTVLFALDLLNNRLFLALFPSSALIACVGFWDDAWQLGSRLRLTIYTIAAIWAIAVIGPVPSFTFPTHVQHLGALAFPLSLLFLVWMTNLFNFMDGVNGLITGFSALFAGLIVLLGIAPSFEILMLVLILGAACFGFLPWNFPKARLFLGDAGSVFLGFTLGVVLIYSANHKSFVAFSLILLIPLTVDATMTLLMRLFKGENILQAHNKHLYQRLTILWQSHTKTSLAYGLFMLLCLLPMAIATQQPKNAASLLLHFSYAGGVVLWLLGYWFVERKIRAKGLA